MPRTAHIFVTVGFLAVILSAGLIQTAAELRQGERPQALELFRRAPTAKNLREFERELQDASLVAKRLRPWAQYAQFRVLADAGEKAIAGREGWLFYRPGVESITQRPPAPPQPDTVQEPLPAITSFRDQLAARGIRLLVVPVPNKESIYPEMLSRRAEGAGVVVCRQTRELLDQLNAAGVEVVDLFEEFRQAKEEHGPSDGRGLYLAYDSHWSPEGVQRAARATARRVIERGWVEPGSTSYDQRPAQVRRTGDVLEMLQVPQLEHMIGPEDLTCEQVVRRETGALYRDAPDAQILVLGDSFLRIYEQDEPGAAGLIAHLARELTQPVASIISDGGASTLVRQELCRRAGLLKNKRVVIWEFVERDIRYGTEGWQVIELPPEDVEQERTLRGSSAKLGWPGSSVSEPPEGHGLGARFARPQPPIGEPLEGKGLGAHFVRPQPPGRGLGAHFVRPQPPDSQPPDSQPPDSQPPVQQPTAEAARDESVVRLAQEVRTKGRIVFSARSQQGDWDLLLCRPDGSGLRHLTRTPDYNEAAPQFSRDAKHLLYRRLRRDEQIDGNHYGTQGELVISRSDGTAALALGASGEYPWASWGPDGRQIACLSIKGISLVDVASRKAVRSLPRKGFFQQLTWSPDGRWLCGVSNSFGASWSVGRMAVATGEANAVSTADCCTPDWFPDSRSIIFSNRPSGQQTNNGYGWTQLWMADAEGKSRRLVYGQQGRHVYGGHVSPDGKYVLFSGNMAEDGDPGNSGGPMGLMRLADAPIIGGPGPELRRLHPKVNNGPVLVLPNGWEPCWTYTEIGATP